MTVLAMAIRDVQDLPGKGVAAVGANPELDALSMDEIICRIPDEVLIEAPEGREARARVVDKEVTASIVDQKNIAILLALPLEKTILEVGGRLRAPR